MRIAVLVSSAVLLAAFPCRAEIYRYIDENGVECFSDRPVAKNSRVVLREKREKNRPARGGGAAAIAAIRAAAPAPAAPAAAPAAPAEQPPASSPSPAADAVGRLPVQGRVTSHVGLRHDPINGQLKMHSGIDIAVPTGTQVRPVARGRVIYSGWRGGYGNLVAVAHDDGSFTAYAHNSVNLVQEGTAVDTGTVIALSGSTGRSTGPHLHFEAWKDGQNVTARYLDGLALPSDAPATLAQNAPVRKYVDEDGTVIYTNLR